jgi:hypothetical protein
VGDNHWQPGKISHRQLNGAIREQARRQLGNVSRIQLLDLGLSKGGIEWRLRNGSLVVRYTGVYAIAPARVDPPALAAAAVLAGGPNAVASHATAGFLWGFVARWEPSPEITLTAGDRRPRHILTHRCPSLTARDVTHQRGIAVTSPARTVLDLAPRLTSKQRSRLINDGRLSGYLRLAALAEILERNPRHPATTLLTPFVENPAHPTRSKMEDDFLAFLARYGLPTPQINVQVNGREVDAFFPEHHLIVELDGWDTHQSRTAFEDDRERDAQNLAHGHSTIRITRRRLSTQPDAEAARLWRILRREAA